MKFQSDPVSPDLPYNCISVLFCMVVYGLSQVAQKAPRLHGGKPFLHAFLCHFHQTFFLRGNLADTEHTRGIREIAV